MRPLCCLSIHLRFKPQFNIFTSSTVIAYTSKARLQYFAYHNVMAKGSLSPIAQVLFYNSQGSGRQRSNKNIYLWLADWVWLPDDIHPTMKHHKRDNRTARNSIIIERILPYARQSSSLWSSTITLRVTSGDWWGIFEALVHSTSELWDPIMLLYSYACTVLLMQSGQLTQLLHVRLWTIFTQGQGNHLWLTSGCVLCVWCHLNAADPRHDLRKIPGSNSISVSDQGPDQLVQYLASGSVPWCATWGQVLAKSARADLACWRTEERGDMVMQLPDLVLENVMSKLDAKDVVAMQLTCKHLQKVSASRAIWVPLLEKKFGLTVKVVFTEILIRILWSMNMADLHEMLSGLLYHGDVLLRLEWLARFRVLNDILKDILRYLKETSMVIWNLWLFERILLVIGSALSRPLVLPVVFCFLLWFSMILSLSIPTVYTIRTFFLVIHCKLIFVLVIFLRLQDLCYSEGWQTTY